MNVSSYSQTILNGLQKEHVVFLVVVITIIHIISSFLIKYDINIYQGPIVVATYLFINSSLPIYNLFMGGFVSTVSSYSLYKLFSYYSKNFDVFYFSIINIFFVMFFMSIFNCIDISSLAYSLSAPITIPKSTFQYLSSYLVACVFILLICVLLLSLVKIVNKHFNKKTLIGDNYSQLEQNIKNVKNVKK